jgi:hypothetical protein
LLAHPRFYSVVAEDEGHMRASGRAVPAEPYNAVKVSTACPSSPELFPHAA